MGRWGERATTAEPSVIETQSRVPTGCLSPQHSAPLPLAGIRIVDFGWVLAGPIVGKLLADMGAEVIKVESRLRLDEMRQSPSNPERDPVFHGLNRNKLSVTVDFTRPEGQELIRRLVAISDAVSENFSPSVLRRYGLDYEALRHVRPDLVMLSLSSAGQYGPLWDVQTYGPTLGPIAGIDGLVGYHGGRVLGSQGFYSDPTAGIHGAVALLAALRYRARTGIGQYVDLAQWESNVGVIGEAIMDYTMNGRVAKPQGNRDPDMAPHQNYRCANEGGWIGICCRDDRDWQVLRQVMGDPEWARDSRFDCLAGRQAHLKELDARISEWTAAQETYDLMHRLQAARVPAAPSLDAGGRFFNEHFVARELLQEIDHPVTGTEVVTAPAWRFSDTPGALFRPAPQLGEHNDYVFGELLGLSADEIVRLAEERVLN
ncbi:MAG: CoA transferase [Chloroflexi bacterium]|nr:CoA transferase [Chloroflexota bacterium]